jgi:mannose-6-phosphate isomerase-like protein (cupin superfamily)
MTALIAKDELPASDTSFRFEGCQYGDVGVSFFLVASPPGHGPKLHRHPYAEVFIVEEGHATFTIDDHNLEATRGQIVVVPPRRNHKFRNSGDGILRLTAIHCNSHMITDWHEDGEPR